MREFVSDDRVSAYVCQRTGIRLAPGQYTQLGIIQEGEVTAGIVFSHYSGSDISLTVAAARRGAFTKTFLVRVGVYLWDELGCSRITFLTEQPRVVELAIQLGAKVEGTKRDAFGPDRDATMLGLLASEWPFKTKRSGSDPLQDGVK